MATITLAEAVRVDDEQDSQQRTAYGRSVDSKYECADGRKWNCDETQSELSGGLEP